MHGVVGQKSNAKFERRALKTQQKHEICTTLPSLDPPPLLPNRPYFHPNPGAPWSQTFPSLCIASSIQMSHVGRTATLQAVYIHKPSERILLRGLSRGRWSCPRRPQISRISRAPRRANPGTGRISAPTLHVPTSCCVARSSS